MKRFTFCVLPLVALVLCSAWMPDPREATGPPGVPGFIAADYSFVATADASHWTLDLPRVAPAPLAAQEVVEVGYAAPRCLRLPSQTILSSHAPRGPPTSADELLIPVTKSA